MNYLRKACLWEISKARPLLGIMRKQTVIVLIINRLKHNKRSHRDRTILKAMTMILTKMEEPFLVVDMVALSLSRFVAQILSRP
jgi:hypothetical protein